MSFDLPLMRLVAGEPAEADRANVLAVLRRHCRDTANRFGYYLVKFADGSRVEFLAKQLESDGKFTGCGFHLRGLTEAVLTFVFDIAVAGDMFIFNAQGSSDNPMNPLALPVSASQLAHLPPGVAVDPVVCRSQQHLAELLGAGFQQWAGYRTQLVGKALSSE